MRRSERRETQVPLLQGRPVQEARINSLCSRANGSGQGRVSQMARSGGDRQPDESKAAAVPPEPALKMPARAKTGLGHSQSLRAGLLQSPTASSSPCPDHLARRQRRRRAAVQSQLQRAALQAALSSPSAPHLRHPPARPLLHRLPPPVPPRQARRRRTRPTLASSPSYPYKACPSHPFGTHLTRTASWPP